MPARPQKGPRYRVLRGLDLANGRRFEADAVVGEDELDGVNVEQECADGVLELVDGVEPEPAEPVDVGVNEED